MHKLSLYLNDDQYAALEDLSSEAGFESAEECANHMIYHRLKAEYMHAHLMQAGFSEEEGGFTGIQPPCCPICGKEMLCSGREDETIYFECISCNMSARLCPDPEDPESCVAEFMKDALCVEARRRSALEKPGCSVTVVFYTFADIAEKKIIDIDQDNLSYDNLIQIAKDAFLALLPFSEKYTPSAVEEALGEYLKEIK